MIFACQRSLPFFQSHHKKQQEIYMDDAQGHIFAKAVVFVYEQKILMQIIGKIRTEQRQDLPVFLHKSFRFPGKMLRISPEVPDK